MATETAGLELGLSCALAREMISTDTIELSPGEGVKENVTSFQFWSYSELHRRAKVLFQTAKHRHYSSQCWACFLQTQRQ